jgi:hypothetical protein
LVFLLGRPVHASGSKDAAELLHAPSGMIIEAALSGSDLMIAPVRGDLLFMGGFVIVSCCVGYVMLDFVLLTVREFRKWIRRSF